MSAPEHAEWLSTTVIGGVALTLLTGALFAFGARRIRQPAVIGEITAGICLGPSLLGLLPGDLPDRLFPMEARAHLNTAAQVGLILYMFVIGWEFDATAFRGRRRSTGIIWICSIAFPLSLGMGLAALIHDSYDSVNGKQVGMLEFVLYLGVAMSITAFPVLARIVTDQRLQFTTPGALSSPWRPPTTSWPGACSPSSWRSRRPRGQVASSRWSAGPSSTWPECCGSYVRYWPGSSTGCLPPPSPTPSY